MGVSQENFWFPEISSLTTEAIFMIMVSNERNLEKLIK